VVLLFSKAIIGKLINLFEKFHAYDKNKKPFSERTAFLHRQINLYKNLNFITSLFAKECASAMQRYAFLQQGKASAENYCPHVLPNCHKAKLIKKTGCRQVKFNQRYVFYFV